MTKSKYKLKESYRGFDIAVYRIGSFWSWAVYGSVEHKITNFTSMAYYFGMNSALNAARKYIDKKKI
jgi:hypothetical protein